MKIVAFVPVKLNNERTPGKNTKPLFDKTPLVNLIQKTLIKCDNIDDIYIYCSKDEIKKYIISPVKFLKRDERFDASDVNVNDIFFSFSKDVSADIYVLAHATAPFQTADSIQKGIEAVKSGKYDSAIAVKRMQEFIWKDGRPLNYEPRNIPRTQDLEEMYVETTGLYIYTHDVINKYRSRIGENPYMLEMSKIESIDINDPIDFEMADAIYKDIVKPKFIE